MSKARGAITRLTLGGVSCLALAGCSIPYLAHVALGQGRILIGRVSIEDRLADPAVTGSEKERLRFVLEVRRFGVGEAGLQETQSYTSVYDTGGNPAVWNVQASADDAFRPYTWFFPIVGSVPYKGWFSRARAEEEAAELRGLHQDVFVGAVTAYSTLGWFADPLFTSMLEDSDEDLANTILHEMAHATVYVAGDSDFNETLATFIGNQGSKDYFLSRGGERDPRLERAIARADDDLVFGREVSDLRKRLELVYAQDVPRERKLAERAEIFGEFRSHFTRDVHPRLRTDAYDWVLERNLDNAIVLALERYHGDLDVFAALHRRCGSDLRATIKALKEVARADHPREALEAASR